MTKMRPSLIMVGPRSEAGAGHPITKPAGLTRSDLMRSWRE
ncbi:hypothetical protein X736_33390 [Mesorhizobium sp. L2C089B000]|nr:hypothetical protein X736_33390 [Mesorhizobium sp. L2C089B000]